MTDMLRLHVVPRARNGDRVALDPILTELTGITEDDLDRKGLPLKDALLRTEAFAEGAKLWSWGKDEFNLIAISCYVEGLMPPLPATRFGNACQLLLKAGMSYADIQRTRSNALAGYHGLENPHLRAHDALDDARSVALVVQHLLRTGALTPEDCT